MNYLRSNFKRSSRTSALLPVPGFPNSMPSTYFHGIQGLKIPSKLYLSHVLLDSISILNEYVCVFFKMLSSVAFSLRNL